MAKMKVFFAWIVWFTVADVQTDAVHCFDLIYYEGSRTCHQLQPNQSSTAEECCTHRSGPPQGYALKLDVHNATVPTYLCSFCKERFVKASTWTEWSECSASCGRGKRKRSYTCEEDDTTANVTCYEEKQEERECNTKPCPPPSNDTACFENFDNFDSSCQWKSGKSKLAKTPEECCQYSNIVAFAPVKSKDNLNGRSDCNSCDKVRNKDAVYCFNLIYYEGSRTCHQLQPLLASSLEECCKHRSGSPQGYAVKLDVHNATIPTYLCNFCKEHFVKASIWTEWSNCSASCGGGKQKRKYTCKQEEMTSKITCYGENQEEQECNGQPCPQEQSFSPAKIITLSIVLTVVLVGFLLSCVWFLCCRNNSTRRGLVCCHKADDAPLSSTKENQSHRPFVNSYEIIPTSTVGRKLPDTPESYFEMKPLEKWKNRRNEDSTLVDHDLHTYEDMDKYGYCNVRPKVRPPTYLEMI